MNQYLSCPFRLVAMTKRLYKNRKQTININIVFYIVGKFCNFINTENDFLSFRLYLLMLYLIAN
jgi:hypothetical protein